jgi:ribosomal protein S18 acetylase RimI-like enzyme
MAGHGIPSPHQHSETVDLDLVRAIERHSARAWPSPEVVLLNGWELRFAPGSRSRRVNSLTPISPIRGKFADTLTLSEKLCRERKVPCTVRITPAAEAETFDILGRKGYQERDITLVQACPIGPAHPIEAQVTLSEDFQPGWVDGMGAASGADTAERLMIERMLQSVDRPMALGTVTDHGGAVAFARAVAADGLIGLFQVVTRPEARRRGHAERLVSSLMGWGRKHGAMRAYLQVTEANAPARRLYERMGFRDAYRYSYYTLPQGAG